MGRSWGIVLALLLGSLVFGSPGGAAPLPENDPALDRECSIEAFDQPLISVLAGLSRSTGVRLSAIADYEDRWVCLRVRHRPLRKVMEALAELYRDEWGVRAGPPRAYVLRRSTSRVRLQARLLQAWKETLKNEFRDQLQATI